MSTKIIIMLLSAILLAGCATNQRPEAQRAPDFLTAPVFEQCPALYDRGHPDVPVDELSEEDRGEWEKIARAYQESLDIYRSEYGIQRTMINACIIEDE